MRPFVHARVLLSYMCANVRRIDLTDCFDTSIRLLAEKKAQLFDTARLDKYLQATKVPKRKREAKPYNFNYTLAESIHKQYFHADWKFYNAALIQMKEALLSSNLNKSDAEYKECIKIIDHKLR